MRIEHLDKSGIGFMKKLILIIFVFCLVIFLSGCSYSTQFYVLNKSESPIQVEYIVNLRLNTIDHTQATPYKMSLSDYEKWFGDKNLQEVQQNEYEFDSKLQKVTLTLKSNEVLRIAIALHHESVLPTENYKFPLENLRLSGSSGERIYSGENFYKQFEKKDDNNYFIEYK